MDNLSTKAEISEFDVAMVRRSLDLASEGVGLVSPGPLVGCVITSAEGSIVGEGTYRFDSIVHAEAVAIEAAGDAAKGGTAYVSLEPHAHHGRTPPCTELLIKAGLARVVATIEDPNPLVSGRGFEQLRSSGIEVVSGVLAEEARRQNERFIGWHKNKRPFVHLKLASSLDGRISIGSSVSTALSGSAALARVHQLRHEHDAILVGANTVVVDDPSLTDRSGRPRRKPLVRIILDGRLSTPVSAKVVTTARDTPTIIVTASRDAEKISVLTTKGVDVSVVDDTRDLVAVLTALGDSKIQSVLVEGGSRVAGAFCDARLVDKVTFIYSPLLIGGSSAPVAIGASGASEIAQALRLSHLSVTELDGDIEVTGYPVEFGE